MKIFSSGKTISKSSRDVHDLDPKPHQSQMDPKHCSYDNTRGYYSRLFLYLVLDEEPREASRMRG